MKISCLGALRNFSLDLRYLSRVNFKKFTALLVLSVLMLGYMGVNIFALESFQINFIRLTSTLLAVFLFAIGFSSKSINLSVLVIGLAGFIGVFNGGVSLNIIYIVFLGVAFYAISLESLAFLALRTLAAAILFSLGLVQFGFVENIADITGSVFDNGEETRERLTFGYKNVNAFAALISGLCLILMLCGRGLRTSYTLAFILSYVFYFYTDTRAIIGVTIVFTFLSIVSVVLGNHRSILRILSVAMVVAPLVISLTSEFILLHVPLADLILSHRLLFNSEYISGINPAQMLIGGSSPSALQTIDNGILLIAGAVGLPVTIFILFKINQAVRICIECRDHRAYAFIMSFWLFSFFESSLVRPESIICIVFWVMVIYKSKIRGLRANIAN